MWIFPRNLVLLCIAAMLLCQPTVDAHSWVEQLTVIAPNGSFVGAPGYPRGNIQRTDPIFSDKALVHLIPPAGSTHIHTTDSLCKDTQREPVQIERSPRLKAYAGAAIALRFQENGHVTLPEKPPGKPANRGTVYVYGTRLPRADEKLLDVHKKWTRDGTGGDSRGVLLTMQNFDDGRCYQINSGAISVQRQAEFSHEVDPDMGADLWCQTDLVLPEDLPTNQPYTLYWVWDWPTMPQTDMSLPLGKQEIYTTCMDVDIGEPLEEYLDAPTEFAWDQSLNRAAIPQQFREMMRQKSGKSCSAVVSPSTPVGSPSPSSCMERSWEASLPVDGAPQVSNPVVVTPPTFLTTAIAMSKEGGCSIVGGSTSMAR